MVVSISKRKGPDSRIGFSNQFDDRQTELLDSLNREVEIIMSIILLIIRNFFNDFKRKYNQEPNWKPKFDIMILHNLE